MKISPPEGYLSAPPSGIGPGIVVLHAWWGLSNTIKDVCNRLSDQGFVAFAPDLYNGKFASTIKEAEILSDLLDSQQAMSTIRKSVDFLSNHDQVDEVRLGVIGFSLGAYFALNLSAEEPGRINAVVIFYGTGSADFKNANAAYSGHFAKADPYEPEEYVDHLENELRSSGQEVTFYRYEDVGHWFFESDRPDAYNAEIAQLAWDRSITFLKNNLQE
jgi:carboxymethylenebutenolidase